MQLLESLSENGTQLDYRINSPGYCPQQFSWVRNDVLKAVLGGYAKVSRGQLVKPAGIWLSGNEGWARWCEAHYVSALSDTTPLKAHISPQVKICELASLEDLMAVSEAVGAFPANLREMERRNVDEIGRMNTAFFEAVGRIYGGIHLQPSGVTSLYDFFVWDCDSTVVLGPENVSFELLTRNELQQLGWGHYGWIQAKD